MTHSSQRLTLIRTHRNSEVARHGFSSHYEPKGAPPLSELDEVSQLAVMLAHERLEGPDSFYEPYVSSLPISAPCAWSMPAEELDAKLDALRARLGERGVEAWRGEVQRNRSAMQRHAEGAESRYRRHLGSSFTAEAFFWAMGMVLSRSFGSHTSLALM